MTKQAAHKGLWRALAVLLLGLGVFVLMEFSAAPRNGQPFAEVTDADGTTLSLPQRWEGPAGRIERRDFHLTFTPPPEQGEQLYLYSPYYEQRLQIWLNGTPVTGLAQVLHWKGPLSSAAALAPLPAELLHEGINRIGLSVETGPNILGSLSRLYIGTATELAPHFRLRSFVEHDLKIVVFGVQAFLSLACLILIVALNRETRFAWLGLAMFTSCLFASGVFADTFPSILPVSPWFFVLAASAAIGFLGFALSLADSRIPRFLAPAALLVPALAYGVIVIGNAPLASVILFGVLPLSASVLAAAFVVLMRLFWRAPSADLSFLVAGLVLMIGAVLHDQLSRLGFVENGILLAQPARMLTLIGIAIFLMLHLARLTRELDQSARTLSQRLRQREEELAIVFERERITAEKTASQQERNRIMAELHDGVAGHLSTIVALSDAETTDQRGIQTVARHALAELRMVIDALVLPEGDLRIALASLRERSIDPLKRLGIKTDWSMVHLPDVSWLSPEQTLSVLRILQEAISNAVRHGMPERLEITGTACGADMVALRVTNAGGKPLAPASDSRQYGLQNMAARAKALGGYTTLSPRPDGAEFTLVLPLSCP